MIFSNDEYEISEDGEKITITKKCLEEWREHYANIAKVNKSSSFSDWFYIGKRDVIIDILKMFEPLEG